MKTIIFIILIPSIVFSQEVFINQLPKSINTNNAELNFIKINDTIAYFTALTEENGKIESNIYTTNFINGVWQKKQYTKYNSEIFNTGNISFLEGEITFFSLYENEMKDCKIVYLEENKKEGIKNIPIFASNEFLNTQPLIIKHGFQRVLYFVSDRKGGFGGLDIWLSIIDNNGNFGSPINLGKRINSTADEITPFYNKYNKTMYFSSNKKEGKGGFDIYKSEGSLNLWKEAENLKELNTNKDEMYLTFYDESTGYFSSNREGAKFENTEYCCNDIFSFKYLSDSSGVIDFQPKIYDYLPLELYFHNDEPDCCTMKTITEKTYKDAYISYFIMRGDYEKQNSISKLFFENVLRKNFNNLNKVFSMLLRDLLNGHSIELQIRGYASPLHNQEYNQNLSKRRISSLINYLKEFKNGAFVAYIVSKKLIITELPFGESNASEKVSDDANNKKESIYSIEAMLERKIEIVDVILKQ